MSKEFEKLVSEAVSVERQLRAAEGWKLSAKAWVASLIETASTTPREYDDFKLRVASRSREDLQYIHGYTHHVVNGIGGSHYHSPPSAKNTHVVRGIAGLDLYEKAKDEARDHGGSVWLLWAMAAEQAGERHPQVFGTDTDQHACESRVMELKLKRGVLLEKLNTAWQHDDLHIGKITSDGAALICFQLAMPHQVPVWPKNNCGERLVQYLAAKSDDAAWAA